MTIDEYFLKNEITRKSGEDATDEQKKINESLCHISDDDKYYNGYFQGDFDHLADDLPPKNCTSCN